MGKKTKGTGAPVVYDPSAHREFVTGFRARKAARRERAIAQAAENEKQAKIEDRRERREFLKESRERFLQSVREDDSDEEDEENEENQVERREYDGEENEEGTEKVTTIVTPLDINPSTVPFSQLVEEGKKKVQNEGENGQKVGKAEQTKSDKKDGQESKETPFRKMVNAIKKKKTGKRHVSYSHKHHQKKSGRPSAKKTTHSERRKRS